MYRQETVHKKLTPNSSLVYVSHSNPEARGRWRLETSFPYLILETLSRTGFSSPWLEWYVNIFVNRNFRVYWLQPANHWFFWDRTDCRLTDFWPLVCVLRRRGWDGGWERKKTHMKPDFLVFRKCNECFIFWTILKLILIGKLFQGCLQVLLLCTENKISQNQFQQRQISWLVIGF